VAGSAAEWTVGWGVSGRPIIIRVMLEAALGLRPNLPALRHHYNNIQASRLSEIFSRIQARIAAVLSDMRPMSLCRLKTQAHADELRMGGKRGM